MAKFKLFKPRVAKTDIRVGNFFAHEENGCIKVSDLNGLASHRISTQIPKGAFLKMMVDGVRNGEQGAENALQNYIAVIYNVLAVIPDDEFYKELIDACSKCIERHKDIYNVKDVSDEEDAKILQEERGLEEAKEAIRKDEAEGRI